MRISKLIKEVQIQVSTLKTILDSMGYQDFEFSPLGEIPDYIASIILALCKSDELDFKKILNKEADEKFIRKDSNNPSLKIFGKIDLDALKKRDNPKKEGHIQPKVPCWNINRHPQYNIDDHVFWIDELFILSEKGQIDSIILDDFKGTSNNPLYTILIGENGVGKSCLLCDIADFFIDLSSYKEDKKHKPTSYNGKLRGVRYHIDGQECFVIRLDKFYLCKIGQTISMIEKLRIPIIVACHFGAFDKFHNQTVNGAIQNKYDVPYYKYVGAHINGNMISSSSIAFRLLFLLNQTIDRRQSFNICSFMDFIKYDHKISLQYSLIIKSRKNNTIRSLIAEQVEFDREYRNLATDDREKIVNNLYNFYNNRTSTGKSQHTFTINIDEGYEKKDSSKDLQCIYKLKQCGLINSVSVLFYKNGNAISSDKMSSGEFVTLSTLLSLSVTANNSHTLILLDEPEISQHPNWQMSMIENLDRALEKQICHTIIATHSHLLVSDLPMNRSSVVHLERNVNEGISSELISSSTYGWSAEEILFKVFKTATDRNRYFGERISILLEKMGNNTISLSDVHKELSDLTEISKHLSEIDPMKSILGTIIKTLKNYRDECVR